MTGQFPSRYAKRVSTGVHVEVAEGYRVCFQLVPELTQKGMVAANAPGSFERGEIFIDLVNSGKEIITLKAHDPLCRVWLEGPFPNLQESLA